jgi:hypothetical protein
MPKGNYGLLVTTDPAVHQLARSLHAVGVAKEKNRKETQQTQLQQQQGGTQPNAQQRLKQGMRKGGRASKAEDAGANAAVVPRGSPMSKIAHLIEEGLVLIPLDDTHFMLADKKATDGTGGVSKAEGRAELLQRAVDLLQDSNTWELNSAHHAELEGAQGNAGPK